MAEISSIGANSTSVNVSQWNSMTKLSDISQSQNTDSDSTENKINHTPFVNDDAVTLELSGMTQVAGSELSEQQKNDNSGNGVLKEMNSNGSSSVTVATRLTKMAAVKAYGC